MIDPLDPAGDFAAVVDGTLSVVVRRPDGSETVVHGARRVKEWEEAEAGPDAPPRWGAEWDLPEVAGGDPLRVGDRLFAADRCGVVHRVERSVFDARVRAAVRWLTPPGALPLRLDVERSVEQQGVVVGWRLVAPAAPAWSRLMAVTADHDAMPVESTWSYRLHLDYGGALDHAHRLVDGSGRRYRVERFIPAEHAGGLCQVEATLV